MFLCIEKRNEKKLTGGVSEKLSLLFERIFNMQKKEEKEKIE